MAEKKGDKNSNHNKFFENINITKKSFVHLFIKVEFNNMHINKKLIAIIRDRAKDDLSKTQLQKFSNF